MQSLLSGVYAGVIYNEGREGICEIEGRVLGGMQFPVLVEVLFCELGGRVLGGMQFSLLVELLFCEIDGQVLDVPLCKIDVVPGASGGAFSRACWPGARGHAVWGAV